MLFDVLNVVFNQGIPSQSQFNILIRSVNLVKSQCSTIWKNDAYGLEDYSGIRRALSGVYIAADLRNNLYFADSRAARIRKLSLTNNQAVTYVGGLGVCKDGNRVTAGLYKPSQFAKQVNGTDVYFLDGWSLRVLELRTGLIRTLAPIPVAEAGLVFAVPLDGSGIPTPYSSFFGSMVHCSTQTLCISVSYVLLPSKRISSTIFKYDIQTGQFLTYFGSGRVYDCKQREKFQIACTCSRLNIDSLFVV